MDSKKSIAETILSVLEQRDPDKSTCPSEIARMLFPDDWRSHMQTIRDNAIALEQEGKIILTQKGKQIDSQQFKGPIRIKLPHK